GGAVLFINLRHTEGHLTDRIALLDGKGVSHEIDWDIDSERCYRAFVIKVDANGGIEWMRDIVANNYADEETYPKWSQSSRNIGQGIYTYALAVDNEGNIFVGGRMCATLTIGDVTIEPHNVSTWNGSAQTSVGNLYIIKLDANGNYLNHLVTEGSATQENVRALQVVGNKLYMFAWIAGLAGTEFSLGGQSATPATVNGSLCVALLDTDLNVDWLKFHESTVSGSAWQMPTMNVIGDKIYLMGTAKYGLTIGDTNYTNQPANKARQSWLVQLNADNGEALACTVLATGPMQMQHGFFGAYEGQDGSLYAIERGLTPSTSFGSDLILYKFNPTTLEIADQAQLALGSCDGQSLIAHGTNLYVMNRWGNKNEAISFINSDLAFAYSAFTWGVSAFQVPETAGGVESITIEGEKDITIQKPTTLVATLLPANMSNSDIIWSSSNPDVISVDENGLVSLANRATGNNAIITATSAVNPNMKASVNVTFSTATGINDLNSTTTTAARNNNVYTIDGRIVRTGTTSTQGLPAGLYIAGGKKVVVK
ncbi:MAG: Ig-like domain-containing protein, partial [Muribaculaceae bacterium]|nr:Ig-like domain-containing protein [Muribaculaceae bacterium]